METDIRWVQRFQSFTRAFQQLEKAVAQKTFSDLEREGLIQRFEYSYELAWKTLQDFLEYEGYVDIKGPRPVLLQALQNGILQDGDGWMAMKKSRELTSHTYDEKTAKEIASAILKTYFNLLRDLKLYLQQKIQR